MQAERETGKRLGRRGFHHPLSYRAAPVRVQKSPQQLLWTRKRQIAIEVMLAGLHWPKAGGHDSNEKCGICSASGLVYCPAMRDE